MKNNLDRARAYLAKLPVSISGQRGHDAAFRAACALIQKFTLSQDEALALMWEWNCNCVPPWDESDLRRKIRDALQAASGVNERPVESNVLEQRAGLSYSAKDPRTSWPSFRPLSPTEIGNIAELRKVPLEVVHLAARSGLLGSTSYQGHRCIAIGEDSFVQVMRFDGGELRVRDGKKVHKKNLPGATGAFLGLKWIDERSHVLLVEGAMGLLEAVAAIRLAEPQESWTALAATSAASRFRQAPELLHRLQGRRICIVADHDEAGLKAAGSWLSDLQSVGCQARVFANPETKDLGPLVAEPEKHLPALRSLFS